MAKISLARLETARLSERMPLTVGGVETHVYFDRPLHPLALHVHRFKAGSAISLEPSDRDRILFVWLGTVEVLGEKLGAGSSAIVERGKGVHLAALSNEATVLEFFGRGEGADAERPSPCPITPRFARRSLLPRVCLCWSGPAGRGNPLRPPLLRTPSPPNGGRGLGWGGIPLG